MVAHGRSSGYVRLCPAGAAPARPGGRVDLGNGLLIHPTQVRILPGAPLLGAPADQDERIRATGDVTEVSRESSIEFDSIRSSAARWSPRRSVRRYRA